MRRGSPMPSFESATLLYEPYGKWDSDVTIVFFWSLSCQYCQEAIEMLCGLRDIYENINIVAVHMPRNDADLQEAAIKKKYEQWSLQAPLYLDQQLAICHRFNNRYVPSIYVFDGSGLRFAQAGPQSWRFTKQKIEKILSKS